MGGGALEEVRRACGSKRRHGTGLVLTAVALAVAGTATQMSGVMGDGGYMTFMHDGAPATRAHAAGLVLMMVDSIRRRCCYQICRHQAPSSRLFVPKPTANAAPR